MLRLLSIANEQTHEEVLLERYERLYSWLVQLTDGDRELAKDLVQDAFVHFMLVRPDLRTISNLDAYLFELAKNLHLSQVRRATNSRVQQLSILDYDSTELGLRTIDLREQVQVQDELRRICHYACVRKETAFAGSVLILRFFRGYYPSEIARVLCTVRHSVDVMLGFARHEAKIYLDSPQSLTFMREASLRPHGGASFARDANDFLSELRQMIFCSCQGTCISLERLKDLYQVKTDNDEKRMSCAELAHIVSCETCLDAVNRILEILPLSQRYAVATIGREPRAKKDKVKRDGGDKGGGFAGGGTGGEDIGQLKRRADETFEHKPKELYVAVNGYTLGSQKVNSKRNEQTLDVNVTEPISFIEVFSEQQVRLLFACIQSPPAGPIKQPVIVELSDGRRLEMTLKFLSPCPSLHVAYSDPSFVEIDSAILAAYRANPSAELLVVQIDPSIRTTKTSLGVMAQRVIPTATAWTRKLFQPRLLLRPGVVTSIVALIMVAALLWMNRPIPTPIVSAAALLQQSVNAEKALAAQNDLVLHRTLDLEERGADGQTIAHRKIVVWQSGESGLVARRLYDDHGKLLAGIWKRKDGVQTFYQHGTQPKLQAVPQRRELNVLGVDYLWQVQPSAEEFSNLVGETTRARVEETPDAYVIHYEPSTNSSALLRASLILGRADLHAFEQRLTIRIGNETREYRFVEVGFERRTPASVAPQVFEPDAILIGNEKPTTKLGENSTSASAIAPSPVVATAALEVEVLQLLNNAGSDLSDQVNVTRTPEGRLRVDGIVETASRKSEILRALAPASKHPALQIAVETVEEAARREAGNSSGPVQLSRVEVVKTALPVEADLRRYFSRQGSSDEQVEEAMRQFANRITGHALQARLYARTLKQTLNRFSQDDLRTLDPDAKRKLMALLRSQALSLEREIQALHRELETAFPAVATSGPSGNGIASDGDLLATINRLAELVAQTDGGVRTSFSLSASGTNSAPVKSVEFWRGLFGSEALVASVIRFTKE
jgi:DNA-directed RNA polymerase specialized sigma24 family protein